MKQIRKQLWQLKLALGGQTLRHLRRLQQWQWLDHEQMLVLQRKRLGELLRHAHQHVPYYREVLTQANIVETAGNVYLQNFEQIPLLDKTIIRARFTGLKSDYLTRSKLHENTSGGSTGEPVRLLQDQVSFEWRQAVKMLDDSWSGYCLCERKLQIWGSERDLLVGQMTYKTRIERWLLNLVKLNAFRMTPQQMFSFIKEINAYKPVQILAYAECIYELARLIEREQIKVYSPRCIMTSAGTLCSHMRETVGRVFNAPVFNRYGSREVGDIACECDHHNGLHVSPFTHFVEILKPDGSPSEPGEVGEVVVTLLTNHAMPLIRYRIGDVAAWAEEPCTCGRGWPLLKEIKGRTTDLFLTKNGTRIHGEYFTHLFYFRDWVEKFQVVQEEYDQFCISIVLQEKVKNPEKFYAREINQVTDKIRLVMGQTCQVQYRFVNVIAPTDSGKYRYTISNVTHT